ncbi:MAG: hypothetical protein ABSF56_00215 [Minisyncoccia bacterium]|jgi:hypothetical protein
MSNAVAQVGPVESSFLGKPLVHAVLGGTFSVGELPLIKAWAEGLGKTIKDASGGKNRSVCVIIDFSSLESYEDPKVIEMLVGLMENDLPYIYRTATWGANLRTQMAEQVVRVMAKRDNIKDFKTKEEALAWLRE